MGAWGRPGGGEGDAKGPGSAVVGAGGPFRGAPYVSHNERKADLRELALTAREIKPGANDEILRCLKGLILGAIHSLFRAIESDYSCNALDDGDSRLDSWASQLGSDKESCQFEQWCIAGYYVNSAAIRLSAGFHLALQRLLGIDPQNHNTCRSLILAAEGIGALVEGDTCNLKGIHRKVNEFKHSVTKRTIKLNTAKNACRELVALAKREPIQVTGRGHCGDDY